MKKIIILFTIIIVSTIFIQNSYSQGFTPPKVVLGFSLDGNFATNDAHGTNFTTDQNVYGMIWGRGFSVHSKFGLGIRRNHRITVSATYNHMTNREAATIPFFVFIPTNGEEQYTLNEIMSGALGYEYAFNPRCKSKQYLGFALTFNYITAGTGSFIKFDPAFRMGAQITTGYEFVLDKNFKYGLAVGLKYNLQNIIGKSNGTKGIDLNDGPGEPGPTYWRRIGILSINFGLNFYTGVEPYRGIK
jgi:hypothetical protein